MFPIHFRTASGLENVLAKELSELGLHDIKVKNRLVTAQGDLRALYQANLWTRTAMRVLRPLANFSAPDEKTLYDKIKAIDWSPWVSQTGTLAIDAHVHSSFTTHSLFLAQLTKDAIADQFREKTGERPSVDLENPDLRIAINLFKNQVEVSLDSSGQSLHKRGYRKKTGEAPLNECLAAGIVLLTEWKGDCPLIDPMTGSGTLAIEAGMIAKNIAPGLLRKQFGFQKWADYDDELFKQLRLEAENSVHNSTPNKIIAVDNDPKMIQIARENIAIAGLSDLIHLEVGDFMSWKPTLESQGVIVMNPPYDERLPVENLAEFCFKLGERLRSQYTGWTAYILMGNLDAARELSSKPIRKYPLFNGAIECELVEIEVSSQDIPAQARSKEDLLALYPQWKSKTDAFANRLKKNFKHYSKWAQRERILCWRVYDRDIPELPFIVDIFGKYIHFAEVPRNYDHSPLDHGQYLELMREIASEVTQIPLERNFLKLRKGQKLPKKESAPLIEVSERGHKFLVNFVDYIDVGLLLEFRKVRDWIEKESPGKDFLNLFSYTGTATVYAAAAGANSTGSVDASSTYLEWTKKNMELNGLRGAQHIYYRSDVWEFLNGSKKVYDLCWVDPPVHSINRIKGTEFNVQTDHVNLLQLVLDRIKPGGKILFTTHCETFEFQEWALKASAPVEIKEITHSLTPTDFERSRPFHAWVIQKK